MRWNKFLNGWVVTNLCHRDNEAFLISPLWAFCSRPHRSKFQINSNGIYIFVAAHKVNVLALNDIILKVSFAEIRLPPFVWKFRSWPFLAKVHGRLQKITQLCKGSIFLQIWCSINSTDTPSVLSLIDIVSSDRSSYSDDGLLYIRSATFSDFHSVHWIIFYNNLMQSMLQASLLVA